MNLKPVSYILRIGHRPERDQRVTTHVGLSSRALGASGMYLAADDAKVAESINDVANRFGGTYFCENNVKWKSCINQFKREGGKVVHLTMYGLKLQDVIAEIRKEEKVLIVVGAEKVPGDMYGMADYNVAVANQPHSEISALALCLDHLYEGRELDLDFPNAELEVLPTKVGKTTIKHDHEHETDSEIT
ncbi:MAG: tRNA (cytidine(56)-2'-O)-methyltransferase [Methanocorpusculum sp.]|nr:tRNA (cytidine(56)-2'-O)-methyltransferase [Methanocorpusculum sp.]MDD2470562.1 tRNA (cytidine(56)-2'-O)-methyltransferase [Methanocorpusculum sp.]MDD3257518.1 tRNA (cytidine(56)-2'-O)-methyltransferase [Methanocorpusculum sp.]MDD4132350.1 tRNA (cytidine(56)-2'-O)-methyltransferase [Methanocorpusculum sp.]